MSTENGQEVGPIDIYNSITVDLSKMDRCLAQSSVSQSRAEGYCSMIGELEKQIPFLGQEVWACGEEIIGYVEEEDGYGEAEGGFVKEASDVDGVFKGFSIINGKSSSALVAVIDQLDPMNLYPVSEKRFMSVSNLMMQPSQPISAHSMEYLKDRANFKLLNIMLASIDGDDELRDTIDFLDRLLVVDKPNYQEAIQLISYVGSLGVVRTKQVVTPDVIFGIPKNGQELTELPLSSMAEDITIFSPQFAMYKALKRDIQNPGFVKTLPEHRLYIAGFTNDDESTIGLSPWSSVVEVC